MSGPLLVLTPLKAQTIESVLRPGDLIHDHARWEEDCSKCHVRFQRSAQDRLCVDCHKDVGQDVRERTGFHGRQKPQPCRSCHTDHKGRDARIVEFDKSKFDHTQADYALRGQHAKAACDKCHQPRKKFREAPANCNACHRQDDAHKGSLGTRCGDCHTENSWQEKARFDHDKTAFALSGRHADARCVDCHKRGIDYKEAPRTCIGCHKKDDTGAKGHKGLYGERCDSCHRASGWKPTTFNHDSGTQFALRGKHRTIKCADCHTGHLYKEKVATACVDCHRKDDDGLRGHRGSLGRDCAACHSETSWKERTKFDHDRTRFPLLGRHGNAKCADCHKGGNHKETPRDCIGCHRNDDKHQANLGTRCESCHTERDWKNASRFDHDKTHFQLRNAHAAKQVQCKDCHADLRHYRGTATDCVACHAKHDKHDGQLGRQCDNCHNDRDWRSTRFDHARTRFPLVGRHVLVKCAECHKSLRHKDAPRDCYSCHRADDKHKLKFGVQCESCHNTRAWGIWDFDHARRTSYRLEGGHRRVSCERCHTTPAPPGKPAAELDGTCIGCHRRDDVHDGSFGAACEQCHTTEHWKRVRTRVGAAVAEPLEAMAWRHGMVGWLAATLTGQSARP